MESMEYANERADAAREIKDRIGHVNQGMDRIEAIINYLDTMRIKIEKNPCGIYSIADLRWVDDEIFVVKNRIETYAKTLKENNQ